MSQRMKQQESENEDETLGRTRGMKVAARIGEKLRREIGSGRRPRVGRRLASTTLLPLKSLCGGGVPSSHPSLGCPFSFFLFSSSPPSIHTHNNDFTGSLVLQAASENSSVQKRERVK